MARRGFFAEIQYQQQKAQKELERKAKAAAREHAVAIRRAEQARKAEERAMAKAARAAAADQKRLEKEAKAAHVAAKEAEVEKRNSGLADIYDEIDSLLAATLDVDDYVDLEKLRRTFIIRPFKRPELETPTPSPAPIQDPREPVFRPPAPPKVLFGKKKKHAKVVAEAEIAFARAHDTWKARLVENAARRATEAEAHAQTEENRLAALEKGRARYQKECAARETEVEEHNARIEALITNLGYGTVDAVQEYVAIVLSNSVYPEHFPVDHEFTFDPSTAELWMRALVPPPNTIPDIKAYKYTKSKDEITKTNLSQKACKDRYSGAVQQVALRSLHEIFEADRRGLIKAISLEVGTETTDPATGKARYMPFIAAAADREEFIDFDLSAVVPAATLDHLGAAVSKNPYGLITIDTTGIRRS